jgi:ubiquinol-cytochrome c reductase cytochrome c subunit
MTNAQSASAVTSRRRLPFGAVLVLLLVVTGGLWAFLAPRGHADSASDSIAVRNGQALFLEGCASCHGLQGQGGNQAPSLIGVGGAAADFQLSTGRMPLAHPGAQAERSQPRYSQTQIDQLVAFVASLGPGPSVPEIDDAAFQSAALAEGGELFRANCAACHSATGQGAPLTDGKHAPNLSNATTVQIIEAMRTGPESMPKFGTGQLNDDQALAIAKYVKFVTHAKDPGGNGIGHYGPIPEGLVAFVVGIGGLTAAVMWIGSRKV